MAETNLTEENFEVAVICALEVEGGAVLNVFDSQYKHSNHLKSLNNESSFTLSFGRIGEQNVVLSWLSIKGKVEAALAAQELRKTFKKVKDVFVVGVCGGVPQKNTELVLGDVVISTEIWGYDSGKQIDKHFERTGELLKLGRKRRSFVNMQGADGNREALQRRVCQILEDKIAESEAGQAETKGASYPGVHKDYLYKPTHHHRHAAPCCVGPDGNCKEARLADCAQLGCGEKPGELIARKRLNPTLPPPNPAIHFGPVASGDIVMKSGEERDKIAAEHQILAFEMEGVGVWDRKWELFVIKGITDYADSHKNKGWQKYAAYTAAAAFRAFLEALQAEKPKKLDTMLDKIAGG
jgi:nucleoside phosphorylase